MAEPASHPLRYQRSPRTLWRRVFDEVLLFPEGADEPLSVTAPGSLVWELLTEPISLADLVTSVATHFQVPPDEIRDDHVALIAHLVDAGAVAVVATGDG